MEDSIAGIVSLSLDNKEPPPSLSHATTPQNAPTSHGAVPILDRLSVAQSTPTPMFYFTASSPRKSFRTCFTAKIHAWGKVYTEAKGLTQKLKTASQKLRDRLTVSESLSRSDIVLKIQILNIKATVLAENFHPLNWRLQPRLICNLAQLADLKSTIQDHPGLCQWEVKLVQDLGNNLGSSTNTSILYVPKCKAIFLASKQWALRRDLRPKKTRGKLNLQPRDSCPILMQIREQGDEVELARVTSSRVPGTEWRPVETDQILALRMAYLVQSASESSDHHITFLAANS